MSDYRLPPYQFEPPDDDLLAALEAQAQITPWSVADFGIPALWQLTGAGKGVRVAVLDTGQPNHPDLIPALIEAKNFSNSPDVIDRQGHATHVCGTIGARNNEQSVVGVAPECEVLCGKVLADNGAGSARGVAGGIRWAADQRADVISLSLGSSTYSEEIHAAIKYARAKDCIVICAAGNAGPGEQTTEYPGKLPEVIAVGAIGQSRQIARFSSRGPEVAVAAPGEKITSTYLYGGIQVLSGTSMAAPQVSGVAALAVGHCRKHGLPPMTHDRFRSLLRDTSDDAGPVGPDTAYGFGIWNPVKLFAALPPPPVAERIIFDQADFTPAGWQKAQRLWPTVGEWGVKLR